MISRRNAPAGMTDLSKSSSAGFPSSNADTTMTSALSAQSTKCLVPESFNTPPARVADAAMLPKSQSPFDSPRASAAISPAARRGNHSACCSVEPATSNACCAMIDGTKGEARRLRPICSTTGTTSASERPTPPWDSGTAIAVQPSSTISCHTAASKPLSLSRSARTFAIGDFSRQNSLAMSSSWICSSL